MATCQESDAEPDPLRAKSIDVYLLPVSRERYELYCEVDTPSEPDAERKGGLFRGLFARFREMLAAAERDRESEDRAAPRGLWSKVRNRALRLVTEKIAEQRLLWTLRSQACARIVHPSDLSSSDAGEMARATLRADADRHRRWLIIDSILFVISGLLVLIPGPNIVAYYFAFQVVGHYLSLRGAQHGLTRVVWSTLPSPELAELRQAVDLPAGQRELRVSDVASRLRLPHLPAFFKRIAVRTA